MNQAEELERGFEDDDEESAFDSEAEEENRHAEEERKKAEKARLEFLDTIFVFVAFIIILGAAAGGQHFYKSLKMEMTPAPYFNINFFFDFVFQGLWLAKICYFQISTMLLGFL